MALAPFNRTQAALAQIHHWQSSLSVAGTQATLGKLIAPRIEGVQLLAERLQIRFPGLNVAGAYSPPFRPLTAVEDAQIVEQINQATPDIVWVGLGTPKQDLWMAAHRQQLTAPVLIGVGAAFDFHTGRIPQAPPWMQQAGLEWLFRLWQEPRRLWYRYLVYNPLFILLVLAQILGLRRDKLD